MAETIGMLIGAAVVAALPAWFAWRREPGPTRRRWARVALVAAVVLLLVVIGQDDPKAKTQPSPFARDLSTVGILGVGSGLLITKRLRQRAGTWPAKGTITTF